MRAHAHRLACGIVLGLLLGCHPHTTAPVVTGRYTPVPPDQEMATLAFLAYLGDGLTGSDAEVEMQLAGCLRAALQQQPGVGGWSLAWGPAVYHFSLGKLDDNMMYVARETANPSHLAIVVRGTNAPALLDWLVEDFDVVDQVAWPYGQPPGHPKISKGTSEGLHILQQKLEQESGLTLAQFLTGEAKAHPAGLSLDVTGHSLGGSLAPTLALWLHDTRDELGLSSSTIAVYPLAGPTPGNADFAAHYDAALGMTNHRLWNPYDIVPLAWNHATMGRMADLYEPLTRADAVERGLIDGLRDLVKHKGYTQLAVTQPPLAGALTGPPCSKADLASEAGWQHHWGYQCALGIDVLTEIAGCPSKPKTGLCPADYCPAPGTAGN